MLHSGMLTKIGLLARLLPLCTSVMVVAGCGNDEKTGEACYVPGGKIGDAQSDTPPLPCLPLGDARLNFLNPGCSNDFSVGAGPTKKVDTSGGDLCCYTIKYTPIDGCSVGRPLIIASGLIVAELVGRSGWSG